MVAPGAVAAFKRWQNRQRAAITVRQDKLVRELYAVVPENLQALFHADRIIERFVERGGPRYMFCFNSGRADLDVLNRNLRVLQRRWRPFVRIGIRYEKNYSIEVTFTPTTA